MAQRKTSEHKAEKARKEREMSVFKRDDMIQKARHRLTVQEQRAVLYAISKIKPGDTFLTEYVFDINEFYKMIGWENESYTRFKAMLQALADKSWWAEIDDKGTESILRWFTTVRCYEGTGKVAIKFHEDVMPFLLQLVEQSEFYTQYNLLYVLPMSSKYAPRLYELLKSYHKNNREWFFEIDKLKHLLSCDNYKNYSDFAKRILSPAVEEINKYTDLCIAYDEKREGRKVTRIVFYMDKKTTTELLKTEQQIQDILDGEVDLSTLEQEVKSLNKYAFAVERRQAKKEEKKSQSRFNFASPHDATKTP